MYSIGQNVFVMLSPEICETPAVTKGVIEGITENRRKGQSPQITYTVKIHEVGQEPDSEFELYEWTVGCNENEIGLTFDEVWNMKEYEDEFRS